MAFGRLANESLIAILVLKQAAQALRDERLEDALTDLQKKNALQLSWLLSRIDQSAPQALVVPS